MGKVLKIIISVSTDGSIVIEIEPPLNALGSRSSSQGLKVKNRHGCTRDGS